MKIIAYGQEPKVKPEEVLRLKLEPSTEGKQEVHLVAVDSRGRRIEGGYILTIDETGITIYCDCAAPVLPKDKDGRVLVSKD